MLWHAYVDESGDRGWQQRTPGSKPCTWLGSSQHFSITSVIVPDGSQTALLDMWSDAAEDIGRRRLDTLHWVNVKNHNQRVHLSNVVAGCPDLHICSVVFSKWDVKNVRRVSQPNALYNWTLRLLIERLSWFAEGTGDQMAMHFAEVKGHPIGAIVKYLSLLQMSTTEIKWSTLLLPPGVDTPHNQRMLQLADTASGAVHAAFEWDDYGGIETRYLEILRPKIWCPPGRAMYKYGLKVNPWPHPRHPWVKHFCLGS